MTILQIGTPRYHHQSGPKELTPEFVAALDAGKLADLLLYEGWKGKCQIIPDYMPPNPRPHHQPRVVVRCPIVSDHPNHEKESFSYLRHSAGPKQGFFWDVYGDDLQSVELAVLALHQAPAPIYCGPVVFRMSLNK